ncbi:hypothetical protein ABZX51_006640 [Aspergillus tubingensis]
MRDGGLAGIKQDDTNECPNSQNKARQSRMYIKNVATDNGVTTSSVLGESLCDVGALLIFYMELVCLRRVCLSGTKERLFTSAHTPRYSTLSISEWLPGCSNMCSSASHRCFLTFPTFTTPHLILLGASRRSNHLFN